MIQGNLLRLYASYYSNLGFNFTFIGGYAEIGGRRPMPWKTASHNWEQPRIDEIAASQPSVATGPLGEEYLEMEYPDALPDPPRANEPEYTRPYYLIFDTETTGLPKGSRFRTHVEDWPRLVQIAWVQLDAFGKEIIQANHVVRPTGFVIPIEASRLHHITTEKAKKEGSELAVVLVSFERAARDSDYLVAHNMEFDSGVLRAEFSRGNLATELPTKSKICTMQGSAEYCGLNGPYGVKWPRLEELYFKLFHASLGESHDALVDVRATAKCFWELRKRGVL